MKIGIIGSGMGRSLGILWAEQGHEVFSVAVPAKKGKDVADVAGQDTQGGTNDEAAFAEAHSARGKSSRGFDGDQDLGWKNFD